MQKCICRVQRLLRYSAAQINIYIHRPSYLVLPFLFSFLRKITSKCYYCLAGLTAHHHRLIASIYIFVPRIHPRIHLTLNMQIKWSFLRKSTAYVQCSSCANKLGNPIYNPSIHPRVNKFTYDACNIQTSLPSASVARKAASALSSLDFRTTLIIPKHICYLWSLLWCNVIIAWMNAFRFVWAFLVDCGRFGTASSHLHEKKGICVWCGCVWNRLPLIGNRTRDVFI